VIHAVTFNYRGNPLVQQAREMIAGGELGPVHFIHGGYLQDRLLKSSDTSWRLDPDQNGASLAVGDIGSHWCDLVQHVVGQRIVSVLAEVTTVVPARQGEDLAAILLRFDGGANRRPPAFATFEDGYYAARVVDAILLTHHRGGTWIDV
jgi:predicted dehydrogenase